MRVGEVCVSGVGWGAWGVGRVGGWGTGPEARREKLEGNKCSQTVVMSDG